MNPDDIPELPEHWQRIREPLAAGDLHEAVKRLRLFVDHDPFALAPRHVLATLLADAGHPARALVQYEKLLTAAITRGDLFRAIAAQRRVDELAGRRLAPATYAALQRWFRLAGEMHLLPWELGSERGLTAVRLLRLPTEVFAGVAIHARLQRYDVGWRIEPMTGACQWNLLWGALRWEFGRAGPRPRQRHLVEGRGLLVTGEGGDRVPLRLAADVPSEALVIGPGLLNGIAQFDPRVLIGDDGDVIVRDERPCTIHRPGAPADLDRRAEAPVAPPDAAPPRLAVEATATGDAAGSDIGDWLEPGLLSPEDGGDSAGRTAPPVAEIPGLQRASSIMPRGAAPTPGTPPPRPRGHAGEIELAGAAPRTPAPGAPDGEGESPEPAAGGARTRRRADRSPVAYRGRVRLLGLEHAPGVEMDCRLVDLSAAGMRIELPAEQVLPLVRMLEGETLRIELEPSAERLELAGRVCWLDVNGDRPVHAGLEFVLITRDDRRAIRRIIERAPRGGGPAAPRRSESGPDTHAA